jgi:UDP-N-acetylglucosamine 2-epimerase
MKVLIVGENGSAATLGAALEAEGVEARRTPGSLPPGSGDEVGRIAAALVDLERLMETDPPDAVLLSSASNLALAAALVATKLQIPVASVEGETADEDRLSGVNERLIEQLADATLAADPASVTRWLRDMGLAEPDSAGS